MRNLLEMKEILKRIYSKYEVFIVPVMKFVLAFITLQVVNGRTGYMSKIDNIAIVLIVSLLCSFLPIGFIIVFAAFFILLHFYALSIEVALVAFGVFLVLCLLFFRFSPKDSLMVLLTPLCFALKIPYVIPISVGLTGSPASSVSVACGVIVHYLVSFVSDNAKSISAMEADEATAKLRLVIDALVNNKGMIVTVAAFVITVIAVYMIRRMSIDYSWTVAIVAGAMLNAVILIVGDLMYDTNVSVVGILVGSVLAAALAKILQFFVFSVDYSRTEKVQFEDDEYYYYVKAVPKMTVAAPTKTVKKINSQMERDVRTRGAGSDRISPGRASQARTVTTERTGGAGRNMHNSRLQNGRSVTAGKNGVPREEDRPDDFEEI